MRTTLSPAFRSMLIFSTELVFGPRSVHQQRPVIRSGDANVPIVQMMDVRR